MSTGGASRENRSRKDDFVMIVEPFVLRVEGTPEDLNTEKWDIGSVDSAGETVVYIVENVVILNKFHRTVMILTSVYSFICIPSILFTNLSNFMMQSFLKHDTFEISNPVSDLASGIPLVVS